MNKVKILIDGEVIQIGLDFYELRIREVLSATNYLSKKPRTKYIKPTLRKLVKGEDVMKVKDAICVTAETEGEE